MTFIADESSVEGSRPREAVELILPGETIRLATGTRDLTIDGDVYTAYPSQRGGVALATIDGGDTTELHIPAKHPFVAQWMAGPPRLVLVNIYRQQAGGDHEAIWHGHIAVLSFDDGIAKFIIASRTLSAIRRRLPVLTVGRACSHILYDSLCQVSRASFTQTGTVSALSGRIVTVVITLDEQWARHGEIEHVLSSERMPVVDHSIIVDLMAPRSVFTMQRPIAGLQVGHTIKIYAGCDHNTSVCLNKFDNIPNYGGLPDLPYTNVFNLSGRGSGSFTEE